MRSLKLSHKQRRPADLVGRRATPRPPRYRRLFPNKVFLRVSLRDHLVICLMSSQKKKELSYLGPGGLDSVLYLPCTV